MRILTALALLASLASAQLFTIGHQGDETLREIDPTNAMTLITTPIVGGSGTGYTAAAVDPITDRVYVVDGGGFGNSSRHLGILDLQGGIFNPVAPLNDFVCGIAFDGCGNLFGLIGRFPTNSAPVNFLEADLVSIDRNTGAMSFLLNTGIPASSFGNALFFDPTMGPNGALVHYSGCPTDQGVIIDPVTLGTAPLGVLPVVLDEIQGGSASAAGGLLVNDRGAVLSRVMVGGATNVIGTLDHNPRAMVEVNAAFNLPGTGEDLVNGFQLGFGPQNFLSPANDVVTLFPGTPLTVFHFSPGATFAYTGELISIGSFVGTGAKPPFLFPGLQIDPASVFLIDTHVGPFPGQLPAAGFLFSFTWGGGPLTGFDIIFQGIVSTFTAANFIFASTNGLRVELR